MTMRAKLGASGRASPRVPPGGGSFDGLCDDTPENVNADPSSAGVSALASRCDHKHDVDVDTPVSIGFANAEGMSPSLARADHVHDGTSLLSAAAPENVNADPPAVGIATTAARADHKHDVDVAAPVSIGFANAEGVASTLSRSDHVHDGTTILSGVAPENVTSAPAQIGVATTAARADHKHDIDVSAPVAVGSSNQTGISTALSRSDHIHDASVLPTQQGDLVFNNFAIVGQSYTYLNVTIAATANDFGSVGIPTFQVVDVFRVSLTGSQTMTGMQAPTATGNKRKILQNVDTVDELTLTHLDGGSLAANQFSLPQGLPLVLGPGEDVELAYDPIGTKWVPIASTGQTYDMVSSWYRQELDRGNQNGVTITFANAQSQRVRLTGNGLITLTFPGTGNYILKLVQDNIGNRVPTWAVTGGTLFRPNGVFVLTTTADATDLVSFYYDGAGNAYGVVTANFL